MGIHYGRRSADRHTCIPGVGSGNLPSRQNVAYGQRCATTRCECAVDSVLSSVLIIPTATFQCVHYAGRQRQSMELVDVLVRRAALQDLERAHGERRRRVEALAFFHAQEPIREIPELHRKVSRTYRSLWNISEDTSDDRHPTHSLLRYLLVSNSLDLILDLLLETWSATIGMLSLHIVCCTQLIINMSRLCPSLCATTHPHRARGPLPGREEHRVSLRRRRLLCEPLFRTG